ncbi:MAG: ABC-2 transporter permease [Blautia sp.]
MKGLIRKDFCQWENYIKQYLLMLIVFFGIGIALKSPEYTAFMTLIIGLSLTMSGFSTDEYYHWDVYACALPIDRKEIVAAKYVTVLLLAVFLSAVSAILVAISAVILKKPVWDYVPVAGIHLLLLPFISALVYPVIYKYGIEKARLIYVLFFLIPFLVVLVLQEIMEKREMPKFIKTIVELPNRNLILILGAVTVVLLALVMSYRISLKVYEKKEF